MSGHVYIGYDENGLFKIGMTTNFEKRLKQIRNMNPAFQYLCIIPCDNPRSTEKELHRRFESKRYVGEWFKLTADDIQAIVYEFTGNDVAIEDVEPAFRRGLGQEII